MTDPISAAIASSVAGKATGKLLEYIESADDSEEVWLQSGLEIAIQLETFYRQNLKDGRLYNSNMVKKELREYGALSRELAIRGELKNFDSDHVELLEELGSVCASLIDQPFGAGMGFEDQFKEEVLTKVMAIKKEFNN